MAFVATDTADDRLAAGFCLTPLQVGLACMTGSLLAGTVLVLASVISRKEPVANALIHFGTLVVFTVVLLVGGPDLLGLVLFLLLSTSLVAFVSFGTPCPAGSQPGWAWVWLTVVACQPVLFVTILAIGGAP